MFKHSLAAVFAYFGIASAAQANIITDYVTFSANVDPLGIYHQLPAPVSSISGAFTLTFDPTQDQIAPTASGLTLTNLSIFSGSRPVEYQYFAPSLFFTNGQLQLGSGSNLSPFISDIGTADAFGISIAGLATGNPTFLGLAFTTVGSGDMYGSYMRGSVTVNSSVSAVPLPASGPLLVTVLAAAWLAVWSRRRMIIC